VISHNAIPTNCEVAGVCGINLSFVLVAHKRPERRKVNATVVALPDLISTTFYFLLRVVKKLRCYDSARRGYIEEHGEANGSVLMKSIMRSVVPYIAGVALALGLAGAARAQSTLLAPNMWVCPAQVEGSPAAVGELDGDVLTWTLVISITPKGATQTIAAHQGSFCPDEPPSTVNSITVNPPKTWNLFWRICATNPSTFSE